MAKRSAAMKNHAQVFHPLRKAERDLERAQNRSGKVVDGFLFGGETRTLLETKWYYYTEGGNVERVVTNQASTDQYSATRFGYARNGQAVTYTLGETWTWTGTGSPTGYTVTYAREFRYDAARQRYLNRELDPVKLTVSQYKVVSDTWSDYDGDTIYGDFAVIRPPPPDPFTDPPPPFTEERRSFEPDIGTFAWLPAHPTRIQPSTTTATSSGRYGAPLTSAE